FLKESTLCAAPSPLPTTTGTTNCAQNRPLTKLTFGNPPPREPFTLSLSHLFSSSSVRLIMRSAVSDFSLGIHGCLIGWLGSASVWAMDAGAWPTCASAAPLFEKGFAIEAYFRLLKLGTS